MLPADRLEWVEGWGMATGGAGYVFRPRDAGGVAEALETARSAGVPVDQCAGIRKKMSSLPCRRLACTARNFELEPLEELPHRRLTHLRHPRRRQQNRRLRSARMNRLQSLGRVLHVAHPLDLLLGRQSQAL